MPRSILAVLTGYLIFGVSAGLLFGLSGQDPHAIPGPGFLTFSILYGIAFALLGGYLAALVARREETLHAGIVAAIIGVIAAVSITAEWKSGSTWSELSVLVLMVPAAVLGGYFRKRSVRIPGAGIK